ncbi:MAG TPA: Na+/H+ antiporter subunit G [Geminicoccaceae bacterium]|jgi:multicomponent K+:H+ antiporter subunit G|nr:Na+/H+ antiporter subunit G [Geminicoccaceae bacterium]
MADFLTELLVALLILAGSFFLLVGSLGLAKLPSLIQRLHAPTKATTLGAGGLLLASMVYFGLVEGTLSFHELLITLFLFLTAPITAHMLAKANILRNRREANRLPPTGRPVGWATLERGEEERQAP